MQAGRAAAAPRTPSAPQTFAPTRCAGIVAPFDFALDRELWRWSTDGFWPAITRTPFDPAPVTVEMASGLGNPQMLAKCAKETLEPDPKVVVWACTSGSFVNGKAHEDTQRRTIESACADAGKDVIAISASSALITALNTLGVKKLAVATPYIEEINDKLVSFLSEHGKEVTSIKGMGETGNIWKLQYEDIAAMVKAADTPDAEAVFLSCTNLPTYDILSALEEELGKPILSANQVMMWAAAKLSGRNPNGPGQALVERTRELSRAEVIEFTPPVG